MKGAIQIEAVVEQPQLLEDLVSKLVLKRTKPDLRALDVPASWTPLDCSSTETYVNGTVMLDDENAHIALSFITSFVFSCIKGRDGIYKIEWSNSLS